MKVKILPKSQENVRKIGESLLMSGKCQEFSVTWSVEIFHILCFLLNVKKKEFNVKKRPKTFTYFDHTY